jgi:hypothetical protein
MRQSDVAIAAEMSPSQLSRVLAGAKVFTLDQLDAVCTTLGLDIVTVLRNAQAAAGGRQPSNVVTGRFGVGPSAEDDLDAVARPTDPEPDEEQ